MESHFVPVKGRQAKWENLLQRSLYSVMLDTVSCAELMTSKVYLPGEQTMVHNFFILQYSCISYSIARKFNSAKKIVVT